MIFGCDSSPRSPKVSLCVCVCHTCYNCTKALNFKVFRLKDLWRTSEGLLKDFRTLDFMVYKIFTNRSPQVFETCSVFWGFYQDCFNIWLFCVLSPNKKMLVWWNETSISCCCRMRKIKFWQPMFGWIWWVENIDNSCRYLWIGKIIFKRQ